MVKARLTSGNDKITVRSLGSSVSVRVQDAEKGTYDHSKLKNRDLPEQHPMSAITGLAEALDEKQNILTSENAGTGISIETVDGVVKINNTQNSAEWGKIDGDINQQTDLKTALDNKQDELTQTQLDAVNSGANTTNIGQIATNTSDIADINALIPNQTTTSNQLADKSFVNSSIATNTAYFIGTFNSIAELEAYSGTLTNNDYAFVTMTDTAGNTLYDRYKYNADTQQWIFEYELNNSSFTANQWASINSNATAEKIAKIATNETAINNHIADKSNPHEVTKAQVGLGNVDNTSDLDKPISTATQTALDGKQDVLTAGANITIENNVISSTAQESFFRGNFNDWSSVPTDTSLYQEDIHGNRVPKDTDFIIVEDASQFIPVGDLMHRLTVENLHATEGLTIRITDETGVSKKYYYQSYSSGFVEIDEYYSLRYASGIPGEWHIKTNDGSPIVIKGITYQSGQVLLCTTNDPATPFDVGMPPSAGQYQGAWRFAYYGAWATDGTAGWTPQYKIENTLPIANEATFGIAKLYNTTGQNTDGNMTQKAITDSLATKQDVISDLATIRSGAALGATAVQPSDLATVATSGLYSDLSGTPTIPTVNNSTISFTQGGVSKGSFTLNQSTGATIALNDVEAFTATEVETLWENN